MNELRPLELTPARGVEQCVHCDDPCGSYCQRCRRAVCRPCFGTHESNHADWRERHAQWTKAPR